MGFLLFLLMMAVYMASPILLASLLYGGLPPVLLVLAVGAPWIYFGPKASVLMFRLAMPRLAAMQARVEAAQAQMRQRLEAFCSEEGVTSEAEVTLDPVKPVLHLTRADGTRRAYAMVPVGTTLAAAGRETWIWAWNDVALPACWRDDARALLPLRDTDWGKEQLWQEKVTLEPGDRFPLSCAAMALDLLQGRTAWLAPWNDGVLYVVISGAGEARA